MGISSIINAIGGAAKGVMGVLGFIPTAISVIETIYKIVGKAKLNSKAKHDIAVELVRESIAAAETFTEKEIIDQAMFSEGLDEVIHGTVKMLNASVWYKK